MKKLTIEIPTTFAEIRLLWMARISKRYKHNISVINEIEADICEEISSGYWSKDISEYMKRELTAPFYGRIHEIVLKHKKYLK